MKKKLLFYLLCVAFLNNASSQLSSFCVTPNAFHAQNVNQNPMVVTNGSDNYVSPNFFPTDYSFYPKNYRNLIFSTGLWIMGFDPSKKIVGAANTYRTSGFDFNAGILDKNNDAILTTEFNKIWFVSRKDIEHHIADYQDNQKIDQPINSIFAWAGKANPFFKQYNNFGLPDGEFAPFYDYDKDGIYDPSKGDFPLPEGVNNNNIPELITWTTYHDGGKDNEGEFCENSSSKTAPINVEVHQTTWAFNCINIDVLNNSNFASYKLHFKGKEEIDSTFFGFWSDPDIGCYQDDYIGCSPSQNASFAYNQDEEDGIITGSPNFCPGGFQVWNKNEMPVGSVKFLNQKMDAFTFSNNGSLGIPPPATTDPSQTIDFYRYLNNQWKDGTPLTDKGFGYNPDSSFAKTKFAFPGNPNDSTQLSMRTANKSGTYKTESKALNIIKLGKVKPNQIFKLDVAFGMHRRKNNTVSQNIDLMYKELDTIQSIYNQGFINPCSPYQYCNGKDCVYPGEVNQDGIINYKDIAFMGSQGEKTGKERLDPLIFAPLNAENWTTTLANGTNSKHADADGNGRVNSIDRGLVKLYYNYTTPNFKPVKDEYAPIGKDITFKLLEKSVVADSSKLKKDIFYMLNLGINNPEIQSLGFQIELDSNYIKLDSSLLNSASISAFIREGIIRISKNNNFYLIDFANSSWNKATIKTGKYNLFNIIGRQLKPIYPSRCTNIRVKNIVAFKKDGAVLDLKAQNFEACFADIITNNQDIVVESPILVSPNPFDNSLTVQNQSSHLIKLQLIGLLGQIVQQQQLDANSTVSFDTSILPKGIYFLKTANEKQEWTTKVIKN